jgi:AraC-like DNA-binding protein
MARWLAKILHQFTELVFASKDSEYGLVISQAIRFIRQHYREHISLDETAEAVSLSPNYFSHIFNEKMQVSFSIMQSLVSNMHNGLLRNPDFP